MKSIKIYIALITCILALISCGKKEQKIVEEVLTQNNATVTSVTFTKEQYNFAGIAIGNIEQQSLSNQIKLNGEIVSLPNSKASVSAPFGGYVKSINLQTGQSVTKGQVLVTIENREFIELQREYLQNKNTLSYLENEHERQQQLRSDNINSEKTFQKITNELNAMRIDFRALEQTLALIGVDANTLISSNMSSTCQLYAPINGFVNNVNVSNGDYLGAEDVLLDIINTDNIILKMNVFESDVSKISVGQNINFGLVNNNAYEKKAIVKYVGKQISNERNVAVICNVNNEDKASLLPGMFVKGFAASNEKTLAALPNEAIVKYNGADYIVVLMNSSNGSYQFDFVPVKKGVMQGNYTAIELPEGVDEQTLNVVTKAAYVVVASKVNSEVE